MELLSWGNCEELSGDVVIHRNTVEREDVIPLKFERAKFTRCRLTQRLSVVRRIITAGAPTNREMKQCRLLARWNKRRTDLPTANIAQASFRATNRTKILRQNNRLRRLYPSESQAVAMPSVSLRATTTLHLVRQASTRRLTIPRRQNSAAFPAAMAALSSARLRVH